MQRPNPKTVTLNDILITEALSRRTPRSPNWQAEAEAMRSLAQQMARDSQSLMQTLADMALELCRAGTAGVSLLETTPDGEEIFRWTVLAGTLAPHVGETTPCHFSPCGVCLEEGAPVLFSHPERYFTYFQAANTPIVEGLVLPLIADSHILGTIWIMSHDEGRHFDSEDVRVMTSLADFTATALLLQQRQTGELLAANAVLETEIVERKQVEAQTHALIANLPGGAVFVVDRNLRYLLAEGEALATAGFKPEDFVGRTIFEALPPELATSYEPRYRKALAGEPFEDEHQAHNHWYISRGTPLRAENGEIHAVLVISYDISERKRTEGERKRVEAALRESQEQLGGIVNQMTAGIARTDTDGTITFVNQKYCEMLGCDMGEMIGKKKMQDFTHPDDLVRNLNLFWHLALTGESFEIEKRYIGKDKRVIWVHNSVSALRDAHGNIKQLLAVSVDITDRKQGEDALRKSEAEYRSLFNSIDEGYAVIEVLADENGEWNDFLYLEVNPAFEQQTGMVNSVGRKATEILGTPNPAWAKIYARVAETGEPVRFEENEATLDRIFDLYAFRLGEAGSRRVAVLFTDITDRKRAEEALRENETRQAFLLQLSDILQQFVQPNDIKAAAMRLLGEHLGVSRAQYHECDSSGEYYSADGVGYANGLPLLDLKYQINNFGTFVNEDFAAGRPYRIDDLEVDPRVSAEERDAYRTYQIRAGAGVPLIRGGQLVAILAIHDVHSHHWTDLEMDLIRETAERIWTPLERARAEAALRQSEEKYRSLFESINDAFALIEVLYDVGNQPVDCRFLEVSPSFEVHTGLTQAQGKTLKELIPSIESAWFEYYHQALVTNDRVHIEMLQEYLNIWFEVDVVPSGDPQDRRVMIVFRNINDRKQAESDRIQLIQEQSALEQERQRAESLAELDRAKTAFFSNVSHEFRTPLTLSLAPLQDALSDRAHPLDPVHRERLELVHRNSLRLLKLVNTLLDFSRIEAGRTEAVYEPTDLATFTTELTSVFRSAIERAGLQLIVACPPLPEPVFVDREMWEKIVLNLLSNAFKFTFEGEIRVSLHSTDGNQAILRIQDTGTGIAPEHLPHLFERFYQVRGNQARTHDGSGIGLALVHELVRLQGGTIEVSSTSGEGTCFTIALPFGTDHLPSDRLQDEGDRIQPTRTLASTAMGATAYVEEAERWLSTIDPPQLPLERGENLLKVPVISSVSGAEREDLGGSPGAEADSTSSSSACVLLVDDNADMREYLTRILSEHVQVEAVADGATALAAAQERVPDLILTDVMMPGLDGFELLEALRADPRTREIPIILLSARAGEEAIVEGLEAGADDYLVKPFSAQELISRVTAHLQMAQLRGEALQEARNTIRSKDEFISVISHELNTPLVSILGWTRMLRSSPPNPVMLSKALDTIERNATLQGKLVQDLLDLSRISAGKLRLNPQPIELKPVIETAIATVTQPAADKGIHLTWQENVTEPVVVMGDSDRLQQVICNLLTNAIKFTPESGGVRLELSVINNDGSADASCAEIRVIDTGDGISADFLPYAFDRFRQAKGAHSAKGLGLGLAIARHIVELHNGSIHAESAGEGQGSTFIVRLPLLQKRDDFSEIQPSS